MLITNKNTNITPELFIGLDKINMVNSFKYLGVHINKSLKFQVHIDNVKSKLSRMCDVTYRLRNHVNVSAAKNLYYSCVYSIFSYCIATWGGVMMCTHRCDALLRLQRRILKNLFTKFFPSAPCLFRAVGLLKLPDVYKLRVAIYMYRMLNLNECPTLRNDLELSYPQHNHGTRSSSMLSLPFPRVEVIRMSFKYQFVNVWNSIPSHIQSSPTIGIFKKNVIEFYIEQYF